MTQLQMKRIVQAVSFSLDDPLVPKVKALVRARQFSGVVRQALTAWFEKEDRDEVLDSLRRIEAKLAAPGFPPFPHGPIGTSLGYGNRSGTVDAEGTDRAASALDSY